MESKVEESVRTTMESLQLICDKEIPNQQQKIDAFAASFKESLESIRAKAKETAQYQGKLEEVKAKLREAEDDLVKALAAKTRKEAKRMALADAIASKRARVEEIKRGLQEQRTRRDEYAAILNQQSLALAASEGKSNQDMEHNDETQEAISWYHRVLGFHIEGGHGVKFTFKNINLKNPNEEFFFTIRHANDTYTLLNCEPPLKDTKELIQELNKTNGLFKFVRVMREKFRESVGKGNLPQSISNHQESSLISVSAPVISMSSDRSDSPTMNEHQVQHEGSRHYKKINNGRAVKVKPAVLSPGSASSLRRSPRFKVKK
ncbi:kinetochore protein spc25 [Quillaja saponaria]|uniref:Kinetochore protein SPC25 n=1 Tax=Quillaja saponaria TaxID=32244 RepID=A0AAD7PHV6_QUISA|nr:kinetochore protein spc25 [Quillaja saponaria]